MRPTRLHTPRWHGQAVCVPKHKEPARHDSDLPPSVPATLPALDRAIVLLGNRAKGELRASVRAELSTLVGTYPDPPTALRWKTALKSIRDDEIFGVAG